MHRVDNAGHCQQQKGGVALPRGWKNVYIYGLITLRFVLKETKIT